MEKAYFNPKDIKKGKKGWCTHMKGRKIISCIILAFINQTKPNADKILIS